MGFSGKDTGGVAVPFSGDPSQPRIESKSLGCPALAGELFTSSPSWEMLVAVGVNNHASAKSKDVGEDRGSRSKKRRGREGREGKES